ncbi:MAG: STAS domain-containing protein [Burkholderiales bacterium]
MVAAIVREGEVLRVSGPVTMETAGGLAAQGRTLLAGGPSTRSLDFAGATEVDSAAVSLIVEFMRAAGGAPLAIAHPPASLASLAALYGAADLVGG